MTLKYKPDTDYYTYMLCYPIKVPFYIGKGKGKRADNHIKYAIRNNARDIKSMVILILYDNGFYEESEAFRRERILIDIYASSHLLTNKLNNNYAHDWNKHLRYMNMTSYPHEILKQKYINIATCKQDNNDISFLEEYERDYYLFYKKIVSTP